MFARKLLLTSLRPGAPLCARQAYSSKPPKSPPPTSNFVKDQYMDVENYPPQKINTFFNICPRGSTMVVERLGKFHSTHTGQFFFAIPFIDTIRAVHD